MASTHAHRSKSESNHTRPDTRVQKSFDKSLSGNNETKYDDIETEIKALEITGALQLADHKAHFADESTKGFQDDEVWSERFQDDETKGQQEMIQRGKSFVLPACLCFVLPLIIAITTGVVVASKTSAESAPLARNVSSELADESSTPTFSFTNAPSYQPSLTPTIQPPNNTYCEEAHQLVVGQNISGSLEDSIGTTVVFCDYSPIASSATFGTPGRWYAYRGEGFPVFAKTDPWVDIHVYFGCQGGCHYEAIYPDEHGIVLWQADMGTDYVILISGPDYTDEDNNPYFTLTFETNDSLETAYGPLTPGRDSVVAGSTIGTKVASNVPACGTASSPTGPGVWYKVTGNGRIITASTYGSPTALDTQISVFSAESSCIDGNDDFCSSKSQVAWASSEDEIYFILVHGKNGTEGSFFLQLATEGATIADADFCANAQSVEVGSTVSVDLSHATADLDLLNCTGADWVVGPTIVGNFYTFTGTGEQVLFSLHYPTTVSYFSPPMASLLTGSSCNALECAVAPCEVDNLTFSPTVCTVGTVLGQTYHIYVYYIEEAYFENLDAFELNGGMNLSIQARLEV